MFKRLSRFLVLALFVAGLSCRSTSSGYLRDDPLRLHHHRFDNGLQLILSENPGSGRVWCEVVVMTGGLDDPADCSGLAHMLEHMLFKGTDRMGALDAEAEEPFLEKIGEVMEKRRRASPEEAEVLLREAARLSAQAAPLAAPNEIDELLQAAGAVDVNAYTSWDRTVYQSGVPSSSFGRWAEIEAERFRNPKMRLFLPELAAICEEKNASLDNRDDLLYEKMLETAFPGHPLAQPILGYSEHLERPSQRRLNQFLHRWYVPANMAVVLSGDIRPEQAVEIIGRTLGSLPDRPAPGRPERPARPLEKESRVSFTYPGAEALAVAWPTVGSGHPDAAALAIADVILSNQRAGLLDLGPVLKGELRSVVTQSQFLRDCGWQEILAEPADGQSPEQALAHLDLQLERLRRGDFEEWLVEAAAAELNRQLEVDLEDDAARVSRLVECLVGAGDLRHLQLQPERLRKVTRDDVVRVAQKWLGAGRAVIMRRNGERQTGKVDFPLPEAAAFDASRQSVFYHELMARQTPEARRAAADPCESVEKFSPAPGITVYRMENPVNGVFQLQLRYPVGSRAEPLLPLAAMCLQRAAHDGLDPVELGLNYHRLGASWDIDVRPDETLISVWGEDRLFKQTLELFSRHFYVADLETALPQAQQAFREQRLAESENPEFVHAALIAYSRFGKQSPFLTRISLDAALKAPAAKMKEALSRMQRSEVRVFYTGRQSLRTMLDFCSSHLPWDRQPAPDLAPLEWLPAQESKVYLFDRPAVQAFLSCEICDPGASAKHQAAIEVYNQMVDGGLGSMFFQELRERRGLAYGVRGVWERSQAPEVRDRFSFSLSCDPEKFEQAVTESQKLIRQPIFSPAGIEQGRLSARRLLAQNRQSFRELPEQKFRRERLGAQAPDPVRIFAALESCSQAELERFLDAWRAAPAVSTLIADAAALPPGSLEKLGKVERVDVEHLITP
ncbi:MAG: hypothetical protein RL095_3757 [Verrucomicrobiota bacterium]|jgi:predicted Zn-dependent peptidase